MQRLQCDMTPIKLRSLPIVWMVGPPGSGRTTQGKLLKQNLSFSNIKVAELLRDESKKDTDRGRLINESLNHRDKKIPDTIVIDLIKEEMLKQASNCKGFVINNFPKNSKQAALFTKEIDEADVLIYLFADISTLIERTKLKIESQLDDETIKKTITNYLKKARDVALKYKRKVEKIRVTDDPNEVYTKIETAISVRVSEAIRIKTESDYAQESEALKSG